MVDAKLFPHPDTPPLSVQSIEATVWRKGDRWHFRYVLDGARRLVLPDPAEEKRVDDLWKTTCFEAFMGGEGVGYVEFNFSPSRQWAAYVFDSRREGMRDLDAKVEVWLEGGESWIAVEAAVTAHFDPTAPLGLTAVIDEEGGRKSYWALAHPAGPPDFHDPSCFIARLPE